MSEHEFATLGGGVVAYIKTLTLEEANLKFPAVGRLPQRLTFYSLHAADGTPLMIAETWEAAVDRAFDDGLEVVLVH